MQEMVAISEEIDAFKRQISSKRKELEKLNKSLMADIYMPLEGIVQIETGNGNGTLWNIELSLDGVPKISRSTTYRVKGDKIII